MVSLRVNISSRRSIMPQNNIELDKSLYSTGTVPVRFIQTIAVTRACGWADRTVFKKATTTTNTGLQNCGKFCPEMAKWPFTLYGTVQYKNCLIHTGLPVVIHSDLQLQSYGLRAHFQLGERIGLQ